MSKEGCNKSVLDELHIRKQVVSKYFIGSLILSEPIIKLIKRELRRIAPDVKIEESQITTVVEQEIFKREIIDSEKTKDAAKKIKRGNKKQHKKKTELSSEKNISVLPTN